ncbi:CRIB domain-containing protein RIC5-like [Rutidosis leptorrhynchoides]|uniref:CRIB domain-containing protein RIC5-like n=1 Tax=Rutidosis leptorrhynchoides TaxID=125765 RepID=UPI003A9A1F42
MKGLLKGLRYISEIFEADNSKEPEIQIGAPTDVKHVAHIGCDGPSSNAPSWMNEFQGSDAGSSDLNGSSKGSMGTPNHHGKSKQAKKQSSNASVNSSDTDTKPSRARRTKNSSAGSESPSQDSGAKKNRKKKRASNQDSSASSNSK